MRSTRTSRSCRQAARARVPSALVLSSLARIMAMMSSRNRAVTPISPTTLVHSCRPRASSACAHRSNRCDKSLAISIPLFASALMSCCSRARRPSTSAKRISNRASCTSTLDANASSCRAVFAL